MTKVPVPGTVVGIGLLLVFLSCRRPQQHTVLPAGDALLPYLSLMFVPSGVIAVLRLSGIPQAWPAIAVAIVVSSVVALGVAGRLAQTLLNLKQSPSSLPADSEPSVQSIAR